MSVVRTILAEERNRLRRLLTKYEELLGALPVGAISHRHIGGGTYLYRIHREGGRVVSEYLGSAKDDNCKDALEQDRQRREYKKKRKDLLLDISELEKALGKFST